MSHRNPEFLGDVLEALSGFVYAYDLVARQTLFISKRWAEDFGYSLEETQAAGAALLESIVHPDDLPAVVAHHAALRADRADAAYTLEYRLRRKNGPYVWMRSIDRPLARDANGHVLAFAGQAHDISAQKAAESAHAEGEARFRAIVESLPDAVFVATSDTRVLLANDAACAQLGYTREELEQMRIADFVAPEFHARVRERLSAPSGTSSARESAHIRKDGTQVPVETVVVAFELDGQPAYMPGIKIPTPLYNGT